MNTQKIYIVMKKGFVNFVNVDVYNFTKFHCENRDSSVDKHIFEIEGKYFYYVYNKHKNIPTFSLREITSQEFQKLEEKFLRMGSEHKDSTWEQSQNSYALYQFKSSKWNKFISPEDCLFLDGSESVLRDIFNTEVDRIRKKAESEEKSSSTIDKLYAQRCTQLSKSFELPFEDVLNIGTDTSDLRQYKQSYQLAKQYLAECDIEKKWEYYGRLFNQIEERENALDELNVSYGKADVTKLSLSDIRALLKKSIDEYSKEIEGQLRFALEEKPDSSRQEICDKLRSNSSNMVKEALKKLDLDIITIPCVLANIARMEWAT